MHLGLAADVSMSKNLFEKEKEATAKGTWSWIKTNSAFGTSCCDTTLLFG
jgi:hypothetical protein